MATNPNQRNEKNMSITKTPIIENVDELLAAAANKTEGLHTELLSAYDRNLIWAHWVTWLKDENGNETKVLASIVDELTDWLAGRRTPVCPNCGSSKILELRDATAYLKLRAITVISSATITEEADEQSVSIFETAEMWRCEDCDFETEDQDVIVEAAKAGPAKFGIRVIVPRVRVTREIVNGIQLAASVTVFDEIRETWHQLAGPDGSLIPLPVAFDVPPQEIETALQIVAGVITDNLSAITGPDGQVKLDENGCFQMGDLFETIGWAVTAEHAKQQIR